jgi:hypothetical protein
MQPVMQFSCAPSLGLIHGNINLCHHFFIQLLQLLLANQTPPPDVLLQLTDWVFGNVHVLDFLAVAVGSPGV